MPEMQVITSRENPHAKRLDLLLRQKKAREESGLFVLEGSRLCLDGVSAGLHPESLLLTQNALDKNPEIAGIVSVAAQTIILSQTLAERLGDTKTPQGVFGVFRKPAPTDLEIKPQGRYLFLHRVKDPGNLGGVLRTAAALGASAAIISECAELYSPKTLRSSMGGVFRIPVVETEDIAGKLADFIQAGVEVFAAAPDPDGYTTEALLPPGGKAVLIGNEANGLPNELISVCTGRIKLPMKNGADSLNAAIAGAILLWEMLKGG